MNNISDNEVVNSIDKAFVCVLDILGFKELTKSNPVDKLIDLYRSINASSVNSQLQSIKSINVDEALKKLKYQQTDSKLNQVMISDSILLWTKDVSVSSLDEIIPVIINLFNGSFSNGLPLRGAITIGPIVKIENQYNLKMQNTNDTYFGNAINEAHELEKSLKLAGCIMSSALINYIQAEQQLMDLFNDYLNNEIIKEYEVSINNCFRKHFIINWAPEYIKTRMGVFSQDEIRRQFEANNKYQKKKGDVEFKITNTIEYFKSCKK